MQYTSYKIPKVINDEIKQKFYYMDKLKLLF
jgi:hypothetical protein